MKSVGLIAPYAVWMILMAALPATAGMYALRSAVTAVALLWAAWNSGMFSGRCGSLMGAVFNGGNWVWGLSGGIAVLVIWTVPENFGWYRQYFIVGDAPVVGNSPYDPAVCGWMLTVVKLLGSAFVISAAEELFFRRWLVDFAGFWWMVALFAIEHDRYVVGAIAGAIYGLLAIRKGLSAAIVAHMTTNFILGIYVIFSGEWQYW